MGSFMSLLCFLRQHVLLCLAQSTYHTNPNKIYPTIFQYQLLRILEFLHNPTISNLYKSHYTLSYRTRAPAYYPQPTQANIHPHNTVHFPLLEPLPRDFQLMKYVRNYLSYGQFTFFPFALFTFSPTTQPILRPSAHEICKYWTTS